VGGHIAPVLKIIRKGKGIAIPKKYITISEEQPFKGTTGKLPYRYLTKIHGIPEEILRQMDAIDKIVYSVAMYRIKKKIFPESVDEITKAPEDLRKRLCFPGSEYDMPVEFLCSGRFDISKDNSTCFVHFNRKKIMFGEIKKYFIRPNFMIDENYLVYRISMMEQNAHGFYSTDA
jgi:hypothetical protein